MKEVKSTGEDGGGRKETRFENVIAERKRKLLEMKGDEDKRGEVD
jgi:hypothetical protein